MMLAERSEIVTFSMSRAMDAVSELAGKVTAADVAARDECRQQCKAAYASALACESRLQQRKQQRYRQLAAPRLSLRLTQVWQNMRSLADRAPLQRTGCIVTVLAGSTGLGVIIASSRTLDTGTLVLSAIAGCLVSAAPVAVALLLPSDHKLASWEVSRRQQLRAGFLEVAEIEEQRRQASQKVEVARRVLGEANDKYTLYVEALKSRRHRLLTVDWRSLRGIPFENFLKDVFEELGYRVNTTKVTNDGGVDLVISRDGILTAVQAKGYTGRVGRDAVQQAFSGMAFYKCNCCVVITNSTFSRQAKEYADAIGCVWIDGARIPALIEGRITFRPKSRGN